MTLRDRERPQGNARPQTSAIALRAPGAFLSRLAALDAQATPLKLRQRQRITLAPAQDDLLFAVQSGVLTARIAMANGDAGLITLYFPVMSSRQAPCRTSPTAPWSQLRRPRPSDSNPNHSAPARH